MYIKIFVQYNKRLYRINIVLYSFVMSKKSKEWILKASLLNLTSPLEGASVWQVSSVCALATITNSTTSAAVRPCHTPQSQSLLETGHSTVRRRSLVTRIRGIYRAWQSAEQDGSALCLLLLLSGPATDSELGTCLSTCLASETGNSFRVCLVCVRAAT